MRLIYLSPVPWCSFSQRPHELVRYFHSVTGKEALWVDPYPGRFPALSDVLHQRPKPGGMDRDIPDWLTVVKPRALPIEPLPYSSVVNRFFWRDVDSAVDGFANDSTVIGIGKPTTLALHLLSKQRFSSSFYDAMDDYPAFYGGWSRFAMANREHKIIRGVSTVLTSSSALVERFRLLKRDVRLVLNACATDRMPDLPKAPRLESDWTAVIGYVGTIGHWFDWELVIALARSYPTIQIRLIGPQYVRPPALPYNIVLQSSLSHADALLAMTRFDAGLIPFKKTTLTSSVDPIKYYEYRALGLPVISSAFGEMAQREKVDGVYLIERNTDMRKAIDEALASRTTLENTVKFRENNSWKNRFDQAGIFALLPRKN